MARIRNTDMTSFTIGNITIEYDGSLTEKRKIYERVTGTVYIPTPEELEEEARIQELRDGYQTAITRLAQIETAVNPTNTQVIAAIKDIAKFLRLTLKVLARILF